MRLTTRDLEILDALARKVRAFTVGHVAHGWWRQTRAPAMHARRRLAQLVRAGYLKEIIVHAYPMLALSGPVVSWREGLPAPEFAPLAWKLQCRWTTAAPQPAEVVLATKATNELFGGPTSRPRFSSHHATHDLHVSEVFLIYLRTRPGDAALWTGEDIRPKSGYRLKDPDALIERGCDRRPLVVEFVGASYDATHLRTLHGDCESRDRDYELW